jgi:putative ABC transport system substrate-binding protein
MRRREFAKLVAATIAWPVMAGAQQRMPVIGFLHGGSPGAATAANVAGFGQGLSENGYVVGKNLAVEHRWAETHYDRLPALAADLVIRKVDVIVAAGGTPPTLAAKAATSTIPIVFANLGDPVGQGVVASLARPGGNLTGVSIFFPELIDKRIELLAELVPEARMVGLIVNPKNPTNELTMGNPQEAARAKGIELGILTATSESEIAPAFASLVELRAGAVLVSSDPLFFINRERVVALAAQVGVPAMYGWREFVQGGGLISYAPNIVSTYRQAAKYVAKILNGAKAGELPVEQPTKIELVINLSTARALGLTVPQTLLARADEVIE